MDTGRRTLLASGGIVLGFLAVQLGALALVEPFKQQGHQFVGDTSDPTISIVYIGAILLATVLMLAAFRFGVDQLVRAFIVFSGAYVAWFVFRVLLPAPLGGPFGEVNVLALGGAAMLGLALWFYPEWYVIDAAGIIMGIGAAAIFGINFGILPALVLLLVLAIYDAISVYGTEHMLSLASGALNIRVPVMFVIPLTTSYSFLDDEGLPDPAAESDQADDAATPSQGEPTTADDGFDRDALFIGLGDAVIPTVLVASAAFFLTDVPSAEILGLTVSLPAATAMVGTLAGLVVLLWMVLKGRAHAGLPLLNGGTILGYLAGALASGVPLVEALGLAGVV